MDYMIKRVVGSFKNNYEYTLIGIRGITWFEIKLKMKILSKLFGYDYDGIFVPMREVKKIPTYCEFII